MAVNALLFVATAATINRLAAILSPVALSVILVYSYCKRFTPLAHLVLGLSLGIAPVGAFIAAAGHVVFDGHVVVEPFILALLVTTWCGGFDIIYALQDAEFDRRHGLHSIPACFSARSALGVSCGLHAVSIAALGWFMTYCPGSVWLWLGAGVFTGLLVLEHLLVTPRAAAQYRHRLRDAQRPGEPLARCGRDRGFAQINQIAYICNFNRLKVR